MCSLSSYKQRERRECGYSRRFYRLNVYTTNLYPPTGALDSASGKAVLDLLTEFNRKGQTTIMVTHDLKSALRGNRILYLRDGRINGECALGAYRGEDEPVSEERKEKLFHFLEEMGW